MRAVCTAITKNFVGLETVGLYACTGLHRSYDIRLQFTRAESIGKLTMAVELLLRHNGLKMTVETRGVHVREQLLPHLVPAAEKAVAEMNCNIDVQLVPDS